MRFDHAPVPLVRRADDRAGRALLVLHDLGRTRATTHVIRGLSERVPAAGALREKGAPISLRDRIEELVADTRAA